MDVHVRGVLIPVNGIDDNLGYLSRVRYTVSRLPVEHLRLLDHITIRDRRDYAGGSTNYVSPRDPRGGLWIMLDIDSFDPRKREINNRPPYFLHYTLLHEMGHVVEHTFSGMRYVRRHDASGYRAMMSHQHRGGGPGGDTEHFADTYAGYFFYTMIERPTDERMRAMLRTPAFAGIDAPRRIGSRPGDDTRTMTA